MTYALPGVPVDAHDCRHLRAVLNAWPDLTPDVRRMVGKVIASATGSTLPERPSDLRGFVSDNWHVLKPDDRKMIAGVVLIGRRGDRPKPRRLATDRTRGPG